MSIEQDVIAIQEEIIYQLMKHTDDPSDEVMELFTTLNELKEHLKFSGVNEG